MSQPTRISSILPEVLSQIARRSGRAASSYVHHYTSTLVEKQGDLYDGRNNGAPGRSGRAHVLRGVSQMPDQRELVGARLVVGEGHRERHAEEVGQSRKVEPGHGALADLLEPVALGCDAEGRGTFVPTAAERESNPLQVHLCHTNLLGYRNGVMPNTLEFNQPGLFMQESHPDSWEDRIRWIVDTYERGATASERIGSAAGRLRVSGEAVRLLYRGKSTPKGDTLASIVEAYPEVNPSWLLTGMGPRTRAHEHGADPYSAGAAEAVRRVRKTLEVIEQELATSAAADVDDRREKGRRAAEAGKKRRDENRRTQAGEASGG